MYIRHYFLSDWNLNICCTHSVCHNKIIKLLLHPARLKKQGSPSAATDLIPNELSTIFKACVRYFLPNFYFFTK